MTRSKSIIPQEIIFFFIGGIISLLIFIFGFASGIFFDEVRENYEYNKIHFTRANVDTINIVNKSHINIKNNKIAWDAELQNDSLTYGKLKWIQPDTIKNIDKSNIKLIVKPESIFFDLYKNIPINCILFNASLIPKKLDVKKIMISPDYSQINKLSDLSDSLEFNWEVTSELENSTSIQFSMELKTYYKTANPKKNQVITTNPIRIFIFIEKKGKDNDKNTDSFNILIKFLTVLTAIFVLFTAYLKYRSQKISSFTKSNRKYKSK